MGPGFADPFIGDYRVVPIFFDFDSYSLREDSALATRWQAAADEIHADIAGGVTPKPDWAEFAREFGELFAALNGLNFLFLRRP